jgi:hypothetical protein
MKRLLLIGLCLFGATNIAFADHNVQRFHASTSQQIIDALLAASSHNGLTVVKIAPGEYVLPPAAFESEFGPNSLPIITTRVILSGEDADTTTLRGGGGRLILVDGGHLTIHGLTLTGGRPLVIEEETQGGLEEGGGAVANLGGTVRITESVVTGNGTGTMDGTLGGAIMSLDGTLFIEDTTVRNNGTSGFGGAIGIRGGKAWIRRSVIRGNGTNSFLAGGAGGISTSADPLVITDSTIAGNSATSDEPESSTLGGGIVNGGTLWLIDSAVVENTTVRFLDSPLPGEGGGIFNGGELNIVNSTIGGNVAGSVGGGIYNEGIVRLLGATITGNQSFGFPDSVRFNSPTCSFFLPIECPSGGGGVFNRGDARVTILSSVIATNNVEPPGGRGPDCFGVITSKGFNAFGDLRDCTVQRSAHADGPDQTGVDPKLADLVDDDRPGKAHFPLLPGSPLIDAGGKVFKQCTPRDQIGQRRTDGDGDGKVECDTGAIEFQ